MNSLFNTILLIFLNTIFLVSGHPVEQGQFPWIVSVQRLTHYCAGSILDKKLVLTAASCVKGKAAKTLHIRAGSLEHGTGGQLLDVKEVEIHPDYDEEKHLNDAALLVLKEDIEYNENAKPVVLSDTAIYPNKATTVAGWKKWGGSKTTTNLRFTKITVHSDDKCAKDIGKGFIKKQMICAGIDKVGKGMCKGDIGGPLIIDAVQYGVVSWGSGCEPPNKPGVYIGIHQVKKWIKETAAKKKMPLPTEEPNCENFKCD